MGTALAAASPDGDTATSAPNEGEGVDGVPLAGSEALGVCVLRGVFAQLASRASSVADMAASQQCVLRAHRVREDLRAVYTGSTQR